MESKDSNSRIIKEVDQLAYEIKNIEV